MRLLANHPEMRVQNGNHSRRDPARDVRRRRDAGRRPPAAIGLEADPMDPWYVQLYWPFVKASDPESELAPAALREPAESL